MRSLSANYESTNTLDIELDIAAGRVVQIIETNKSEWKDHPSHRRTTYRLVDVVQHSPDWTTKFDEAAERYFVDRNAWWEHKQQAAKVRSEEDCRTLAIDARERLVKNQKRIDMGEVRSAYEGLVALHDREMKWDIEAAAKREQVYSKPPVDWATTNLAGEPRRRADYIGKVVILDFWYRGCAHCILALPKVIELDDKYKHRGVNNDSNLEDAHHVVQTYSIPYESVRDVMSKQETEPTGENGSSQPERRISSEYRIDAWPTFVVLDQKGRVAEVIGGNADELVDQVSQVVDDLLANSPGD